jgi:hypothetical protein
MGNGDAGKALSPSPTPELGELLNLRAVAAAALMRYSASVRVGVEGKQCGSGA